MYRIKIDRSRCIGCLTCVTACVVSHETESGDARNRVTIDSDTKPAPIFCRHCERPECVYTCMTGAMKKNPVTGYVEYDKEQCASCYMCTGLPIRLLPKLTLMSRRQWQKWLQNWATAAGSWYGSLALNL